ncbi:MAG TPA: hypothetical protein VM243_13990 [Phycisphaerae bacterium]|nr:hypothetical protein [Phycisphaerae bacterium]
MDQRNGPTTTLGVVRVFASDLLVLAAAFVAVELGLRLVAPQEVHRLLTHVYEATDEGFRLRAGSTGVCNNGYGDHVFSVNSWRARDRDYGAKQPGEWRILCLGDSFSENQALEVEQIWPNVLESDLATAFPERVFSVINAGQAGWSLWNYHDYIEEMLPRIEPDVVVVAIGNTSDWARDARHPKPRAMRIWSGLPVRRDASLLERAKFAVWYVNEWAEGVSQAYVAFRDITFYPGIWTGITKVSRIHPTCTDAASAARLFDPTVEVLGRIKGLCDARGTRLALLSVPRDYECLPSVARLRIELERPDVARLDLSRPGRMVKRLAGTVGVPYYDPADVLRSAESRPYSVMFAHWNELGNRLVAEGSRHFLERHHLLGD